MPLVIGLSLSTKVKSIGICGAVAGGRQAGELEPGRDVFGKPSLR